MDERPALVGRGAVLLYSEASFVGAAACPRFGPQGAPSAPVPNGSFARFDLPPGTYRFVADTSWCYAVPASGFVRVVEGKTTFAKVVRGGPRPGAVRTPGPDPTWISIDEVPESVAAQEITDLGRSN